MVETVDRGVLEELVEVHTAHADLAAGSLVADLLGSGRGDEDLLAVHVASRSVVLRVRDPPRVKGDENERVEDEAGGVVDGLGGGEGLVAAWRSSEDSKSAPIRVPSHVAPSPISVGRKTHTRGLQKGRVVVSLEQRE